MDDWGAVSGLAPSVEPVIKPASKIEQPVQLPKSTPGPSRISHPTRFPQSESG